MRLRAFTIALLAIVCALFLLDTTAAYPDKPVRLILVVAAGTSPDIVGRLVAARMSDVMGQQFVVDNRPGAAGAIGIEAVARATPDGYTLTQCGPSLATMPALDRRLPFDPVRGFTRIAVYGMVPYVLVVHPSVPARNVAEFIGYAKANGGKLKYASTGIAYGAHLTMERFKSTAGVDMLHVPYKSGAQAMMELTAGQVQAMFVVPPAQLPNINTGKVRALAVASARRSPQLPDVPTFIELGYTDFEATSWWGLCGPAKMPSAVTMALISAIAKTLATPELRQRLADQGVEIPKIAGAEFDVFFEKEVVRWGKAVKDSGIARE
jgi:tripartite-type tricarboxylate transporter receptor subunit TctC